MWFDLNKISFLNDPKTNLPLGLNQKIRKQGQFYCGNGANNVFGRQIAETHLQILFRYRIEVIWNKCGSCARTMGISGRSSFRT